MKATTTTFHTTLRNAPIVQRLEEVLPLALEHVEGLSVHTGSGGVHKGGDEQEGVGRAGDEGKERHWLAWWVGSGADWQLRMVRVSKHFAK